MSEGHALLSPSGSPMWLVCAGGPAMESVYPDDSNEYSEYGTGGHEVARLCLTENFKDPSAYWKRRIDVGPAKTVEVDSDMVNGVRKYVLAIQALIERYKLAGATSVEMLVEQRVPVGHITGEEGAEGTADVILIVTFPDDTTLIHVVDLKFGQGVKVFAEGNTQGMLYALGAVKKLAMVAEFNRIVISIHQPRVADEPSEWEITIDELNAFAHHASAQAKTAMIAYNNRENWLGKSVAYLTAGEHCKKSFCKARGTCPARQAYLEAASGAGFEVIGAAAKNLAAVPDDRIGAIMDVADDLEDMARAVRAEVERRLLAGTPVPSPKGGHKLVDGRMGNRAWDGTEEVEKLLKSFRLKQEQMYNMTLISPTDAEKLAPKYDKEGKVKGTDKTVIKDGQWQKLQPHIKRAPGKPSVAPMSDPRPARRVKPASEGFEPVAPGSLLV